MKKVVVYVMFMMCVLSVVAQKDTVVVRDSWHKDTIRQKSGTRDTVVQESEMIIWDNTVRESERRGEKKGAITSFRGTLERVLSWVREFREHELFELFRNG